MRFYLDFDVNETRALSTLAKNEFRDIRTQAAVIIHDELIRRGLLPGENRLIPVWTKKESEHEHAGA